MHQMTGFRGGSIRRCLLALGFLGIGACVQTNTEDVPSVTDNAVATQAPLNTGDAQADTDYTILTNWQGPYGGVPPVEFVTPENLQVTYLRAMDLKRAEISAIVANPEPPTFENTVLAYEAAGQDLERVAGIFQIFVQTSGDQAFAALAQEIAPLRAALDDAVKLDAALFERIKIVYNNLEDSDLSPIEKRLTRVIYGNFIHAGAQLNETERVKLKDINAQLAGLRAKFAQNAIGAEHALAVIVDSADALDGLPKTQITSAKAAAEARGEPDKWAIPISYPSSNPALKYVHDRSVREQVWRLWNTRAGTEGEFDNRPIANEIIELRHQKANLLGFESFAHYQTSARMVGTPEVAMNLLMSGWENAL